MSHHGNNPPHVQKALSEALRSLLGEYPDGRMNANARANLTTGAANDR